MTLIKRFLGIDFGTKRMGVAISDERNVLAFPKEVVPNDAKLYERLSQIIKKEDIGGVVIGESNNSSGAPNLVSERIDKFVSELGNKFQIPVYRQQEFFTSVEARRYEDRQDFVDDKAAALILQRYLDKINNKV